MIGRTLGHYRIVEQIGMGGMATVYKAYDPDTDRHVAIKVLPEHFCRDPKFRQRFEREAKAIAKLEHLHILPLFAYGEEDSTAYMVMRYLKAGSLTERIQAGALPLAECSRLLSQIASALDHAHANGVLHRDVKPSNVLLDTDGNAFLTDFGIAKMVESSLDLTGAGILGTPAYMSPEQCRGSAELTPASDQYALGIILYEMVTGRAPYQAETPIALIHKQLFDPLPMPRQLRPDLPEEAEQVILKTLTKDPALRYPSCGAMAVAFARAVAHIPAPVAADGDRTLAATAPVAVTAPAVIEEPTMLHPAMAAPVKRRLPVWVWAVVGVVVVLVLAAGMLTLRRLNLANKAVPTELPLAAVTETSPFVAATESVPPTAETPENAPPPLDLYAEPRYVKPCDWEGYGSGLCIFLPKWEQPFKILETGFMIQARPSWSPDGQQIAFSAKGPGDQDNDIYLVNPDGSNLIHLPDIGNDIAPVWSPDGEWLAFHSNCNLMRVRPDGAEPTILWRSDGRKCADSPEWSPDSQQLAVSVLPPQEPPLSRELWVVSVEDGAVKPIITTNHKNWECLTQSPFSPDGTQVAYLDGECKPWLIKADGSGQPEAMADLPYDWMSMSYPRWGKHAETAAPLPDLSATSRQVKPCEWEGHGPGLCIYSRPGEPPVKILENENLKQFSFASWSPDGTQITFSAIKLDGNVGVDRNTLFVVNADGSNLTELPQSGNDMDPAWSPDGEWLVFHSNCDLAAMHPDGSRIKVLWQHDNKCAMQPQWSPDSRSIVLSRVEGAAGLKFPLTRQVVIMSDGRPTTLATVEHKDQQCLRNEVAFSPDGMQVAYLDGKCQAWLVKADGSGQAKSLGEFPYDWSGMTYPQWGGKAAPR